MITKSLDKVSEGVLSDNAFRQLTALARAIAAIPAGTNGSTEKVGVADALVMQASLKSSIAGN